MPDGITGGISSVGQPLDMVKTNMQLYPNLYKNMFSSLYMTGRGRGIRGLYVVCVPALLANSAENAVMVGSYGHCRSLATYVVERQGYDCFREVRPNLPLVKPAVKQTLKADGLRGPYRGLQCALLREFVCKTLFFGLYERCQKFLNPTGERKEKSDLSTPVTSGSIAGLGTRLVAYPMDVVKSRVQMSETQTRRPLMRKEIQKAGFRGFYTRLWSALIKIMPVTSIFRF
ncbi:Mitochondrial carrier domain,Mitochondrial substrate/solute carrier [Cinara cedri]|uniref:Mitochondrial carrier domain,Mitochondrial substrate/solute carrier n=1 Tax=Cinara cedri TaxID=506608 RepID=A0A5E4MUC5_9HEMI|nr:Mitochondrial carrier domain,Mitochondrial substrate/solute carrier [Cinara cedri]